MTDQEDVKRSVRFPEDLYRRLERIAKKEHRTVVSQMIAFLEDAIRRYEKAEEGRGNSALLRVEELDRTYA